MKISVFGDSVGKGIFLPEEGHYKIFKADLSQLTDKKNIELKNNCVFGSTITKTLSVIGSHGRDIEQSDVVLIEIGGNDCDFDWQAISDYPDMEHECKTPLPEFEEKYEQAVESIKQKGGRPVALSMPPIVAERYFKWISKGRNGENILRWLGSVDTIYRWQEMYNLKVMLLAEKLKVKFIDIRTPFLKEHNYKRLISADGIHPAKAGYELIYRTVASSLA